MKHNLSVTFSQDNVLWGVMLDVNETTNGMLGIAILGIIFIVAVYVMGKRMDDFPKASAYALYITTLKLFRGGR